MQVTWLGKVLFTQAMIHTRREAHTRLQRVTIRQKSLTFTARVLPLARPKDMYPANACAKFARMAGTYSFVHILE